MLFILKKKHFLTPKNKLCNNSNRRIRSASGKNNLRIPYE